MSCSGGTYSQGSTLNLSLSRVIGSMNGEMIFMKPQMIKGTAMDEISFVSWAISASNSWKEPDHSYS